MELHNDTFPSRAYKFATEVWSKFTDKHHTIEHINICILIRRVCVYLPLVFALHAAALGWLVYLFFYYPITRFGHEYGIFWLIVLGTVAFIAAAALTIKFSITGVKVVSGLAGRVARTPTGIVALRWWHDIHERVCTPVRFTHRSKS